MKKLRVGVWLSEKYKAEIGGGFGYYNMLVKKICNYQFKDAEIVFLSNNNEVNLVDAANRHNVTWKPFVPREKNRLMNLFDRIFRNGSVRKSNKERMDENGKELKKELSRYVDVIYYPIPICAFPNFPYIYTLWDLGHLSTYAFPEVSMNGVFEARKKHHDFLPQKALMVFAESESGRKDITKYLGINEERIKVVPLFPSEIVNGEIAPSIPKKLYPDLTFIHYPSQYWAHKNHYNLLVAFTKVIARFPSVKLVLTGSDKGNKEYIKRVIMQYGLENQVIDLGFVSNEELKWLYMNSKGLVMPTFLGPTNMPLLEAAALNCPIACSRLDGHVEELGDYGYYFDPKNPEEMANAICSMIEDKTNNATRVYKNNFNIDNALMAIDAAFSELKNIRFCWGTNDEIY